MSFDYIIIKHNNPSQPWRHNAMLAIYDGGPSITISLPVLGT